MATDGCRDWASVLLGKTSGQPAYNVADALYYMNRVPVFNIAIPFLTIAHACAVYINLHREERSGNRAAVGKWQSFFCFMIGGAGGSIITSFLLSNFIPVFNMGFFPVMLMGWTLLTFIPGLYHLLADVPFINAQMSMLAAVNRALCLCQGVEMALRTAPGEYILAVICGITLSSGGGILVDLFQLNHFLPGMRPVSDLHLFQRLALIFCGAVAYTVSLSSWSKSQGPWDELAMLSIALILAGNGLWNSFITTKAHPTPRKRKLHLRKSD